MPKKKTFLETIKTVFSPFIENIEVSEPDPDKEGLVIEEAGGETTPVNHRDLMNVLPTQHHSNTNDPTTNQKAAMTGANSPAAGNVFATMTDSPNANELAAIQGAASPSASNVFATMNDAGGGGQTLFDAIVAPSGGDYTTIQAAIDAGKKTIFVRNGTYNITSAITLTDKCQIIGESKEETIIDAGGNNIVAIHIEGSNFHQSGSIAINNGSTTVTGSGTNFSSGMVGRQILLDGKLYQISAFTDTTHITITTAYRGKSMSGQTAYYIANNLSVRVSNLAVSNVGGGSGIIYCKYVKDSRFENLRLFDNVTASGCFKTNYFVNNIIKDCQIGKGQGGVLFDDYSMSNCIQRNVASKITTGNGFGLQGYNTKYNQIIDNNCSYNNAYGVSILQGKYNMIANNICNNNGNYGIMINEADNNYISNNEIKNNYYSGIKIDQANYCIVNNNYFYDNYDNSNYGAIYVYKGDNNLISGNKIYLSNYGIYVYNSNKNCITGNYIYDPDSHGIYLWTNSDNNALTVNYIYQAGGWGIIIGGLENDSFVHGNYFLTCASGGLSDGGIATTASDNLTK